MAVTLIRNRSRFQCLSSDTKPLGAAVGDILFESDTGLNYQFNGTIWVRDQAAYSDDEIAVPCTITEDIFHYCVHEKIAFTTTHHIDVANSAYMGISFKTPAAGVSLHVLPIFWVEAAAVFAIRRAPTMATDGTLHPVSNRHDGATSPATTVEDNSTGSWVAGNATIDATVSAGGTIINGPAGQQVGIGKFSGGTSEASHEWVLRAATVYDFELTNGTVSNNECYLELNWFAVPDA
jgi:hypothetical protein